LVNLEEIFQKFKAVFRYNEGIIVASAPGRVNIIGEHTDYNEGFVLPTPIRYYIWVAGGIRSDNIFHLYAADYDESHEFMLDRAVYSKEHRWANYVMGVVQALLVKGHKIGGADILIMGEVPQDAGLSSSSALEVAAGRALNELFKLKISPIDLAYLGKAAENDFVGVKSGIMDQFVSSLGEYGKALLIDCRENKYKYIDLPDGYSFIVVHSGVKRKLDASLYNERVRQCEEGVAAIRQTKKGIRSLRDVTLDTLQQCKDEMPDIIYRRCRHVVSENARVLATVKAMRTSHPIDIGRSMYSSHESLKKDYEVSCMELDTLVNIAKKTEYVLGARLTGAGFGGCTINLLPTNKVDEFNKTIYSEYKKQTGIEPSIYLV